MNKIDRDNLILNKRARGATVAAIAREVGLSPSTVTSILRRNSNFITDRIAPQGMRLRTAMLCEIAFGRWPSPEFAQELSLRRDEFLYSYGTRTADAKALESWLTEMGYPHD